MKKSRKCSFMNCIKLPTCTWGYNSVVNRVTCSVPVSSSILYMHVCHPRGALPAHWACRILSGPWGIVVVRVSWPEHLTIIKKKKKKKKLPTCIALEFNSTLSTLWFGWDSSSSSHDFPHVIKSSLFGLLSHWFFEEIPKF